MIHSPPPIHPLSFPKIGHLERVVLRGHIDDEVIAEDGDLQHDVVAHARDLCEEEEREEARDAAEAGCETTAVDPC